MATLAPSNETKPIAASPLSPDDAMGPQSAIWILMTAYFVFTMMTGFVLLEAGCVPITCRANAFYKNLVDILIGGTVYWLVGYGFAFGTSVLSNQFIGVGDFALDVFDYNRTGYVFVNFVFQMSFESSGTTIVSGTVAGRMRMSSFSAYCIFFTLTYSIVSHWLWAGSGFLHALGSIDASGSGVVHLCGGTGALATILLLGPRKGRFDPEAPDPVPSNHGLIVLGTFFLWWGWLGFNSGGAFGISGGVWKVAARAATTTIISAITGGMSAMIVSKVRKRNLHKYDLPDLCNGVLGGLVAITAPCTVVRAWEASIIGLVAGAITTYGGLIVAKLKIDDPVGAIPVHFMCGAWGLFSVGLFVNDDPHTFFNLNGVVGLFNGGGFYSLGVQCLAIICIVAWTAATTFFVIGLLKIIVGITLSDEEQVQGPDYAEHGVENVMVTHDDMLYNFPGWRTIYDKRPADGLPSGEDEAMSVQRRRQMLSRPGGDDVIVSDVTGRRKLGTYSVSSTASGTSTPVARQTVL